MLSSFATKFFSSAAGAERKKGVELASVEVHDIETAPEKRPRTLKHLIRLNHVTNSVMYHDLQFHNHAPHILGSAYLLGASPAQLNSIYDEEAKELEHWEDSPEEVSQHDWQSYLGDKRFQRAYVDFFEDQLVRYNYDWQSIVHDYLFNGKEPLINGIVGGLGHPLIHLGYAFELSNRELAMEALALTATNYSFLHKYLDDPSYTARPAPTASISTQTPLTILASIAADPALTNLFRTPGPDNIGPLFENAKTESALLKHWNAWSAPSQSPTAAFSDLQKAATALLVTSLTTETPRHDFFLLHLLTTTHALRILFPLIPSKHHISLLRQHFLLTLALYTTQLTPHIDASLIPAYSLPAGKDTWTYLAHECLHGRWAKDAHFVKGVRALKVAAETWPHDADFYLHAAVKFAVEFDGWGGFAPFNQEDREFLGEFREGGERGVFKDE
ncbi:MAG: hypothetical protein M1819_004608 [Sarea resinae]|nr:MAG: hypothetical protein M1819_004608 [Sarea resinae]